MKLLDWRNWYPLTTHYQHAQGTVVWQCLGDKSFTEPFFSDTLRKSNTGMRKSNWQQLVDIAETFHPVIEPSGFIFHASRCGSTLIAQMLARLNSNIVISEAPIIDMALRANTFEPDITTDTIITRLKAVLNVMGQKRFITEQRLFIKFDAWNVALLPIIEQAYPHVPKIFLYRNPVEILISHQLRSGMHMIPNYLKGKPFDLASDDLDFHEYGAWLLSELFNSALRYFTHCSGLCINYTDLVMAAENIFSFFYMDINQNEIQKMKSAARFHAKSPNKNYSSVEEYQNRCGLVSDELTRYVEKWLAKPYRELENIKLLV